MSQYQQGNEILIIKVFEWCKQAGIPIPSNRFLRNQLGAILKKLAPEIIDEKVVNIKINLIEKFKQYSLKTSKNS